MSRCCHIKFQELLGGVAKRAMPDSSQSHAHRAWSICAPVGGNERHAVEPTLDVPIVNLRTYWLLTTNYYTST